MDAFNHNESGAIIQSFEEAVKDRDVHIRIIMAARDKTKIIDVLEEQENIEVRYIKKSFQNNITVFVVDNLFSLVIESRNNRKEEDTMATYSSIESTAMSYISMFETLWIRN